LRRLACFYVGKCGGSPCDTFDQDFDLAAADLPAPQSGLDDLRVVEHKQIVGPKQGRQVGKKPIMQPGTRIKVQQPTAASRGGRSLGNQFRGEVVVELGQLKWRVHAAIWSLAMFDRAF